MTAFAQPLPSGAPVVTGQFVHLLGQPFYKIEQVDTLAPFFMSILSSSNHWLFLSSTGGLTAGRTSAEAALFPYYTVDKVSENSDNTGPKTLLRVQRGAGQPWQLWEPFSERQQGRYTVARSLYKNVTGGAVVFEEINHDLQLTFRYAWRASERFGWVRSAWLTNLAAPCNVELLDGIQNLLPANVSSQTQNIFSVLLDAYKRAELHSATGLAIYSLSSRLTDLAEPSESLLATRVAQVGLPQPRVLLSSAQLDAFRAGQPVIEEPEIRGQRCAYFAAATLELPEGAQTNWHFLADVEQDASALLATMDWLAATSADDQARLIEADLASGQNRLWEIVAGADGLQHTSSAVLSAHHFANVLFNSMRGGVFVDQYTVATADLREFVAARNRPVLQSSAVFFDALPARLPISELLARAEASGDEQLLRLCSSYLPLSFSRRHGDPSRPWNRFAINIRRLDGTLKLDYEGNWRDIFQNWEALACSYPEWVENMIATFLNATTVDGYNPYRITYHGLDWEAPEPGNPWANIGYWNDHQIIYLLKLMELSAALHPGALERFMNQPIFSYANVPYRIKPYADLLQDPYNSIAFDWPLENAIRAAVPERGSDAKLVSRPDGTVQHATLAEKLLTLLLAKLANFVPEGGIWMNTQRPEWNDANNALAGKGLSIVTLAYLRRYLAFCRPLFASAGGSLPVRAALAQFCAQVSAVLRQHQPLLRGALDDAQRRAVLDGLGEAGSVYRADFYANGLSETRVDLPAEDVLALLDLALEYVDHSLRANRRADNLYHAYNILHLQAGRAAVSNLSEMLEGQVALLSSGLLSAEESLALLDSLRHSALYTPEQHSYILYPDRALPGFLAKNNLNAAQVQSIPLLASLLQDRDRSIITPDGRGGYHFAGPLRNARDVQLALDALQHDPRYAQPVADGRAAVLALFEAIFHHDQFTGRSGSFFAYEGLGSIYWHMVAKLLLAVQETALRFRQHPALPQLVAHYNDIRAGLGFNKTPAQFGAFPTDPYSHTPKGQGAKQPGMTGQVKEEILTRRGELGLFFADGALQIDPFLLDRAELLAAPAAFDYLDVHGQPQSIELPASALACTLCQVPVILQAAAEPGITVYNLDGTSRSLPALDQATSREIFTRSGTIERLLIRFVKNDT